MFIRSLQAALPNFWIVVGQTCHPKLKDVYLGLGDK